jgi:hypothetical protein
MVAPPEIPRNTQRGKAKDRNQVAIFQTFGTVALAVVAGATSARNGLEDLDLFTVVADNEMTDEDGTIGAHVGALEAGIMRLYGVVLILSGWVRRCARLLCAAHGARPPE